MLATERASRVRKPTWKVEDAEKPSMPTFGRRGVVCFDEGTVYAEPIRVGNNRAGYWGVSFNEAVERLPFDARVRKGGSWVHLGNFATAWEAGRVAATYKANPDAAILPEAEVSVAPVPVCAAMADAGVARPLVLDFDAALPQDELDLGERKGPWTEEEDDLLREAVAFYGAKQWSQVASRLKGRIGKQCRERWHNHINPDIKKDAWTEDEDKYIWESVQRIGKRWSTMAINLPGRTDNQIKNRYNCSMKPKSGYKHHYNNERPHWTLRELRALKKAVPKNTPIEDIDWVAVAEKVTRRHASACRTRWLRCIEAERAKRKPVRVMAVPIKVPVFDNGVDLVAHETFDEGWCAPTWTLSYRMHWGNGVPVRFKFPPAVVPAWVRQAVPKVETQDRMTKRFLAQKRREAVRAEKAEQMVTTLFA